MFVCNVKVNGNKLFKLFFLVVAIIIFVLFAIAVYKVFCGNTTVNDEIPIPEIANLSAQNYTNVLKTVHENPNQYIGQKIHFIGYVHREIDFSEEEFVLARDMVINKENDTVIVGFLCKNKNAIKYKDHAWVEITGTIQKGFYHSEMPIIEISDIKEVEKPKEELVSPPDDYYIPTVNLF